MRKNIAFAAIALIALSACHAKQAVAPQSDVSAISSGTDVRGAKPFPPKAIHIGPGGNEFFLWKLRTVQDCPSRATIPVPGSTNPGGPERPVLGACPDDIAFVIDTQNRGVEQSSCQLNSNWKSGGLTVLNDQTYLLQTEENSIRELVLSKQIKNSEGQILTAEDLAELLAGAKCTDGQGQPTVCQLTQDQKALAAATAQQATAKTQLESDQQALDAELQKPTAEQDQNKIAQLKTEIASLATKIQSLQKRIDLFNAQIADITNAPKQITANVLTEVISTFQTDGVIRDAISNTSQDLLTRVKNAVDFYDFAPTLMVDFGVDAAGNPAIDVQNWNFQVPDANGNPVGPDDELNFSTSDGSITGATYTEMGGTYEFDLHGPDGIYHFKVSRTRYGACDRLAHFQGDIVLYPANDPHTTNPRRGVAVMDEQVQSTAGNGR